MVLRNRLIYLAILIYLSAVIILLLNKINCVKFLTKFHTKGKQPFGIFLVRLSYSVVQRLLLFSALVGWCFITGAYSTDERSAMTVSIRLLLIWVTVKVIRLQVSLSLVCGR